MTNLPDSIPKQPDLKPAEDYYRLRKEGIGFIEKMASSLWTDYNTHDPGITILEILCYAITDIAYRTNWEIKDLLTQKQAAADSNQPFPNQAFFTAKDILTINPVTTDDFRRLLIDLPEIRNAWVFASHCVCDFGYYAKCQDGELQLSYQKTTGAKKVEINGLYDVLLEFEPNLEADASNIQKIIDSAKNTLQQHRNLDEDFCRISTVSVENIAVCADIEVAADADIERVQARIWFEIERYFNPPVRFYTLDELLASDVPVESIFNGPMLNNGFIRDEDLQAAQLKTVLRSSDIVNQLMDIEGVIAVNNLLLSKYNAEDKLISGAADPKIDENGNLEFPANKISAAWSLYIQDKHQPRFNPKLSRFLFLKNGLPFHPRKDEAYQTWMQLRGEFERPKISQTDMDLKIPSGIFRQLEDYYPLQYSFPLTYGIGLEGLSASSSPERKAQAKQLKAYLMVFEQLLANSLAQLANVDKLFSLDFSITRTYFVKELSQSLIQGYDELVNNLNKTTLETITETPSEFNDRRNRFLNHLMARFGEQFGEYALLLTNYQGQQVALQRLIEDKISFLRAYPLISRNRNKAFNYQENPYLNGNFSGLKKRISLLLGYPDLVFTSHQQTKVKFPLKDGSGNIWLAEKNNTVQEFDLHDLLIQMVRLASYAINKVSNQYQLELTISNLGTNYVLQPPKLFDTEANAQNFQDELITWATNERTIVVEHLLLRPKFLGDALYPVCTDGECQLCGAEAPYSFRLTFVMPGWTTPYNTNLEMRNFADRTIRQETPAHLLAKICWVDDTGFEPNPCGEPILATLAEYLEKDSDITYTRSEACECAWAIFEKYRAEFESWFESRQTYHWLKATWASEIALLFKAMIKTDFTCTQLISDETWQIIHAELLNYFTDIALYGWQFERFETAWHQWLAANAQIDWTKIDLKADTLAILQPEFKSVANEDLCVCAAKIVSDYGQQFYQWMQTNILAGKFWQDFDELPKPNIACDGLILSATTKISIAEQLTGDKGYGKFIEVSYCLWIVVNLLSELRNTYPGATLHDCDDGSDQNPVRLGSTALGNYPLRSPAT